MPIIPHWFLPTNGDSRSDLSLGNAVGGEGSRVLDRDGSERAPTVGYIGQIARSADQLGFVGALTPTSSWCEDGWLMAAALSQVTERYTRAAEYLHLLRELWIGEPVDFSGEHVEVRGAQLIPDPPGRGLPCRGRCAAAAAASWPAGAVNPRTRDPGGLSDRCPPIPLQFADRIVALAWSLAR
jgi:hypothetical protein